MKRNLLTLAAIALIATVGIGAFENTAAAHRDTKEKRQRSKDNVREARGRAALVSPLIALNRSWMDLTFRIGADPETVAKALPIYQETRKALQSQIKAAGKSNDTSATAKEVTKETEKTDAEAVKEKEKATGTSNGKRATRKALRESIKETQAKLAASLKEILTEEQIAKLTELKEERQEKLRTKRRAEARKDTGESRRDRRGSRRRS